MLLSWGSSCLKALATAMAAKLQVQALHSNSTSALLLLLVIANALFLGLQRQLPPWRGLEGPKHEEPQASMLQGPWLVRVLQPEQYPPSQPTSWPLLRADSASAAYQHWGSCSIEGKNGAFFAFFFCCEAWLVWFIEANDQCYVSSIDSSRKSLQKELDFYLTGFLFNYCQGVTTPSAAPCKAGRGAAAAVQSTGRARRLWADSTGPNPLHEIPISGTPYESTPSRAPHTGACAKPAPAQTGSIVWSPPLAAARGGAGVAGR